MLANFWMQSLDVLSGTLKWCWVLRENRDCEWEGRGQRTGHTGGWVGKSGLMTEKIDLKQQNLLRYWFLLREGIPDHHTILCEVTHSLFFLWVLRVEASFQR